MILVRYLSYLRFEPMKSNLIPLQKTLKHILLQLSIRSSAGVNYGSVGPKSEAQGHLTTHSNKTR